MAPLIENFFGKLKEFKRVAMQAGKTDQSFAAISFSPLPLRTLDQSQQALS